ncbi:hypothetical protein C8F04DRAFT_1312619 [Mycena alexandri]|uniref:BRCA2 OB1 domain-containing protein n=1 Tax=Mycena alexandri TaxID=1745969 RepID=A0AAD6T776_9AGAR|nr:hypothetical protein C8F04DRAFT_1312619 [Mycena alexandri]
MRPSDSPSTSPVRKRQRLSESLFSPTYDDQVGDLSQEDLAACDEIEAKLSQSNSYPSSSAVHERLPQNGPQTRLDDDPDNPFASASTNLRPAAAGFASASGSASASGFASAAKFTGFGAASALRLSTETLDRDYERSPSPEAPPEPNYDSWFAPAADVPPPAFQTAKFAAAATAFPSRGARWIHEGVEQGVDGALKYRAREGEGEDGCDMGGRWGCPGSTSKVPRLASPERPALRALDNSFNSPGTPSPAEFSRPSFSSTSTSAFSVPGPARGFVSPMRGGAGGLLAKNRPKAFKSPLLPQTAAAKPPFASSPLNPARPMSSFVAAGTQHPLAGSPIVGRTAAVMPETPLRTSAAAFVTPARQVQSRAKVRPAFVTPFKAGMKPGEPGRALLEESAKTVEVKLVTPAKEGRVYNGSVAPKSAVQRGGKVFFDLTPHVERKTLLSSGLVPQEYTEGDLEGLGIAVSELKQITPALALYYSFHTPSSTLPADSSPPKLLGPAAALEELLARGCALATKLWVDNHWCLILWKLAGMVCLEPEREGDVDAKRWCWAEVMRQLLYRYERELNGGVRPPLRSVATQDAPASCPMVLCVSNITWSEAGMTDDGMPIPPHPELEVTDGWYRLRAQVDAPLARAVRRGLISVGRKIGVVGARLSSERKEASEVLEAYNSTNLILSGNSSHLVPWHAKLGFQISPWVATMNSLTADGGVVAAMNLVILKTYPVAFLEFYEDENGEKQREGPRNERDEAAAEEKWKRRREVHESKLREELAKKEMRFQGYAERLERRAGARFAPSVDDEPTDELEELYDELEDSAEAAGVMSRVSANTAGWLARFIGDRLEKERERVAEEIDQELKRACPPREVRNFRVLVVQDACTRRRGANRSAQLTVWDAVGLGLEVGQGYAATNLVPTAQGAWMDCSAGSEIYLSTRRDSKLRRLYM